MDRERSLLRLLRRSAWFAPAVLLACGVMLYPALRTLALSFLNVNLKNHFHSEFAGAANYVRLIHDSRFHSAIWTTTVFTTISVAIEFALGLALAISADSWKRGKGALRTILLIPWTLPTAVIGVLWAWIFNDQYGILNSLLLRSGIVNTPISWLGTSGAAMSALVIADVWKTTPFVFLILLAGLQSIPGELYEALEIDGGGIVDRFRYITWPFLARFVFVALIFRLIQAFSVFDLVYVMTGGGPGGATETLSLYAYRTMMRYLDFGYASTLATATVAMLAVVAAGLYFLIARRHEDLG
jgi:multiple sugar transport system permease protein